MSIYPRILLGDLDLTAAPFMWEFGADFGGPEVVYETLLSMLRDGSSISSNRVDNRTFTLSVIIEAADFLSLAQYEAQLIAECDKPRNTLTLEPGDAFGPPSVFETFRASATLERDDDLEQVFTRRWSVTLQALPWPRSAEVTVTPAQTTATETLIDNGSSLTGWSLITGASIAVVSGAVQLTTNVPPTSGFLRNVASGEMARTGAVTLSTAKYIKVRWTASVTPTDFFVYLDGVLLVEAQRGISGGVNESFFTLPVGTTSGTVIKFGANWTDKTTAQTLSIDNVSQFTGLPFIGTAKQQVASLIPGGSVRTQGSLAVEHASSALGTALAYTYPAGLGWTPPLRQWWASGTAPGADATAVSGSSQTITAGSAYNIPASILPPGSYLVVARLKSNTATEVTIRFNSYTFVNSVQLGAQFNGVTITFATTGYEFWTLGRMTLPPLQVGPSGFVQVAVQREVTDTETVTLDEVWLFHESGDLTMVDCGTAAPSAGGSSNRLWADAPSLDDPQGSVWVGYSADRSDAVSAGALCKARPPYGHNLEPGGMNVFTVTSNADTAAVSSTHFRRWHTHAAE